MSEEYDQPSRASTANHANLECKTCDHRYNAHYRGPTGTLYCDMMRTSVFVPKPEPDPK